ncbi:MAG TPA: MOSC domain-containing protein [Panacibacter sp.]|nr:MOSC domain-containing protein [Panacibacter sp.]
MLTVSELFIYPVKSLGGFAVPAAVVTDRGLQHDRRWMLVDEQNNFLTQREFAEMALLQVTLTVNGLQVRHKINGDVINIPAAPQTNEIAAVKIWDDECIAQFVNAGADEWFSDMLSTKCRLVYMPDSTKRKVDESYATNNEITSLSDGYPLLIIGQASLADLNSRLAEPLPINRFRPNIVFTGGAAFEEDSLKHFTINHINFYGVKPCARCPIPTIDQGNATKSKEPLKTLATYRMKNNKVYFGQNLLHNGEGIINVGDKIIIHQLNEPAQF